MVAALMIGGSPLDDSMVAAFRSRNATTFDDIRKMSLADVFAICGTSTNAVALFLERITSTETAQADAFDGFQT